MAVMAILQEVDKCIRCNGCYIACKRTWNMKAADFGTRGLHRVAPHQRVVIKSQKKTDMGPFVRYSCWHCTNPPCAGRCPFGAIKKEASGAVSVDFSKCNPESSKCLRQCITDCTNGGYPKVGVGQYGSNQKKAFKCTMCFGRAGVIADPNNGHDPAVDGLPTKSSSGEIGTTPELAHWPACVYTCPAKAMTFDTKANILAKLAAIKAAAPTVNGVKQYASAGTGSMYWVTTKSTILVPPKSDPFVEDHVTPMVSGVLASPLAKAAIVPTLVVGGLMALSARRAENEKEVEAAIEGEV